MRVIHLSSFKKEKKNIVIGIGKFDGLHLGHQLILRNVIKEAEKNSFTSAIFTFRRFPVDTTIYDWEEKISLIKKEGIDLCIWCNFDEIRQLEAEEFLDILSDIGVKKIVVGKDFHFGAGRKGDVSLLKDNEKKKGFQLILTPPQTKDGEIINSTKIRLYIKEGNIKKANDFLGRTFSIKGRVVQGDKIGSKIGFPTANLDISNKIEISEGIYAGKSKYQNKFYPSAIYIGNSPTFDNQEKKFEVFIFNFNKDLYGKIIKVYILDKIRDKKNFKEEQELKKQILKDINKIEKILRTSNLID